MWPSQQARARVEGCLIAIVPLELADLYHTSPLAGGLCTMYATSDTQSLLADTLHKKTFVFSFYWEYIP